MKITFKLVRCAVNISDPHLRLPLQRKYDPPREDATGSASNDRDVIPPFHNERRVSIYVRGEPPLNFNSLIISRVLGSSARESMR
tara:strand:+ start:14234 stop:14488 length:255 start_codon:yes stop_codon:yes gene_type:complete